MTYDKLWIWFVWGDSWKFSLGEEKSSKIEFFSKFWARTRYFLRARPTLAWCFDVPQEWKESQTWPWEIIVKVRLIKIIITSIVVTVVKWPMFNRMNDNKFYFRSIWKYCKINSNQCSQSNPILINFLVKEHLLRTLEN